MKWEEEATENPGEFTPRADVQPLEPVRWVQELGQAGWSWEDRASGQGKQGRRRMEVGGKWSFGAIVGSKQGSGLIKIASLGKHPARYP